VVFLKCRWGAYLSVSQSPDRWSRPSCAKDNARAGVVVLLHGPLLVLRHLVGTLLWQWGV